MDRSAAARYSLLALAVFMLGVLAAMILSVESHADAPIGLEFGPVVFLLLCGLHSWYLRRELEPIRRGWVGGRPRSLREQSGDNPGRWVKAPSTSTKCATRHNHTLRERRRAL